MDRHHLPPFTLNLYIILIPACGSYMGIVAHG
jgi:hypothetical protein